MSETPFENCKYMVCDLPGQCINEGKCHHPKAGAVTVAGGGLLPSREDIIELASICGISYFNTPVGTTEMHCYEHNLISFAEKLLNTHAPSSPASVEVVERADKDLRYISDKFTEVVAYNLHYFERMDKNQEIPTWNGTIALIEESRQRYRTESIFHAKTDAVVAGLISAMQGGQP